ncbi:MAG: hypothetical protein Q9216_006200, partial [Gyalolechia sp. 2 TL-2023]
MLDFQRLHISPLNPELLHIILSESIRQSARNITYHTLQTFPDRRYGYIDLPAPEADRLKKKLHGSILQGAKMKVEKARPEKARKGSRDADKGDDERKSRREKKGKSGPRQDDGVLQGVELPKDRKVKRGWTEPSAKEAGKSKKGKTLAEQGAIRRPSTHTDGPECLFKTKIPSNARVEAPQDTVEATAKKRKRGDTEKTRVVHEFEKTTSYPSFLRSETGTFEKKPASSYIEGKGWVDEDGRIVEVERASRRTRSKAANNKDDIPSSIKTPEKEAESISKRGALRSGEMKRKLQRPTLSDETSSSGGSNSGGEDEALAERGEISEQRRQSEAHVNDYDRGDSEVNTDQVRALSISRSSPTPPLDPVKEVHPLEALFKRPKSAASQTPQKPSLEVRTGFSFFEPDAERGDSAPLAVPQTPFTQQDFQERRLRSAAPTPDTAAPSKTTFGHLWSQDSGRGNNVGDEGQGDDQTTPTALTVAGQPEPDEDAKESDFAKWFYEHRGETNRAWKRRRREAAKEKRQKQNKRRHRLKGLMSDPMPPHQQSRPAFGISMESRTNSLASRSAIFTEPKTPNSWTARSFTTLAPSDSPSQAQFPKHSQASLLLGHQREKEAQAAGRKKDASSAQKKQEPQQPSCFKRNLRFIALAVMFQIALLGITTMVVLIVAAAKSRPPKRINPGYYTGLMVSFTLGLASIVLAYVKWNERKVSSTSEPTHRTAANELNRAEFGLAESALPPPRSPMADTRAM